MYRKKSLYGMNGTDIVKLIDSNRSQTFPTKLVRALYIAPFIMVKNAHQLYP